MVDDAEQQQQQRDFTTWSWSTLAGYSAADHASLEAMAMDSASVNQKMTRVNYHDDGLELPSHSGCQNMFPGLNQDGPLYLEGDTASQSFQQPEQFITLLHDDVTIANTSSFPGGFDETKAPCTDRSTIDSSYNRNVDRSYDDMDQAEYVESIRGQRKLVYREYVYLKDAKSKQGVTYWHCNVKYCKARARTDPATPNDPCNNSSSSQETVTVTQEHNHPPDPDKVEALRKNTAIKNHFRQAGVVDY